ncbi:MAG: IS4 family transposase [Thermodesulfovibrionales bacterium]
MRQRPPHRELHFDHSIALLLLYFFNPVLTSLRGIQQASHLKKVKKMLGISGTSLGSLSEAGNVFDASLLKPLIGELADKAIPLERDPKLRGLLQSLVVVDSTLLPALPKMLWALWLDDQHKAAKLHLELDILKHSPVGAVLTDANANERAVLRSVLSQGKLYVLDAGFGEYKFFQEIIDAGSSFVACLRDNAVRETLQERALSKEDRRAGVQSDRVVRLGGASKQDAVTAPVRIIEIFHQGDSSRPRKSRVSSKKTFRTTEADYMFLLITDRLDLSAEVIALLYRYRWQIELFFRWFKCVLGCTHLLSFSRNGVTLQVYCALIASMLITLWTGCKPTKRTFEMLCFYFMGWADEEEVEDHLKRLKETEAKKNVQ